MSAGPLVLYEVRWEPPCLVGVLRREVDARPRRHLRHLAAVGFFAISVGVSLSVLLTAFGRLVFAP